MPDGTLKNKSIYFTIFINIHGVINGIILLESEQALMQQLTIFQALLVRLVSTEAYHSILIG